MNEVRYKVIEDYKIYYNNMGIHIGFKDGILYTLSITDENNLITISLPRENGESYEPLVDIIMDYLQKRLQSEEPKYYLHRTTYEEEVIKKR